MSAKQGLKRKRTITDFFPSSNTWVKDMAELDPCTLGELPESDRLVQDDVQPRHSNGLSAVSGLERHDSFVTQAEEAQILSFLDDTTKNTWRTDLSRRSMHFGGTYCLFTKPQKGGGSAAGRNPQRVKPDVVQAPRIPLELEWLLDRFQEKGVFPPGKRPQYCIVNEYRSNLGISAHVENFSFDEPVVGLSLLDRVDMRFHELERPDGGSVRSGKAAQARKTGQMVDVSLPGRSLCVMRGDSRWKWQHEIRRSSRGRGPGWKRVSLTFRYKQGEG